MSIKNDEIARIFSEIGDYLEMQGVAFKPRAYQRAAVVIAGLTEEAADIYKKGGLRALEEIPGVGASIAEKIEELIKTGRLGYYQNLKNKVPVKLSELRAVEGLGPRHIKFLYQKLGIKNLQDLEEAAEQGKIRKLVGFGTKSEEKILKSIQFLKKSGGRFLLNEVLTQAREIEERLKRLPGVGKTAIAGSLRRRKETIGDIDILVTVSTKSATNKVADFFASMPEVVTIFAKGPTKSMVKLKSSLDADLRVVPEKSYGAALSYFTGSKEHNVCLRELAIKKSWKLNEYGLFAVGGRGKTERWLAGRTEEEIYQKLGLVYIEPELREMTGEIEAAQADQLPKLIGYNDLRGDLQVQTNWSDGQHSIEAMGRAAAALGLEYILITDHSQRLAMAHGLDEKRVLEQLKEIDRVNDRFKKAGIKLVILKGSECDILKDGRMDLPDQLLAKLDIVGGSIHSHFKLSRSEQTERLVRAMTNPQVDIIFHPTGRLINRREPYDLDIDRVIEVAKATGTVLEVNAFPDRLDLKDEHIRRCVAAGVKLVVSSDSHSTNHFSVLEYGLAQARRGWAEKSNVINAWPLEKMKSMIKHGRR